MLIKNSEDLTERKFPQLVILTRLSVLGKRTSRTNPLPATYAARLSPTSTTSVTTSPFTRQSNRTVARCAAAALLPPPPSDTTGLLSRDTHIWALCIFYFCECDWYWYLSRLGFPVLRWFYHFYPYVFKRTTFLAMIFSFLREWADVLADLAVKVISCCAITSCQLFWKDPQHSPAALFRYRQSNYSDSFWNHD